ncbi:MAG: flagellar assembly peptidoglycan hydrolase FlgJ [Rhodocyclaceae bacterium]|nr:flagellar assembly peptidoglycan hydrolase FlgJ [Rhodocyclaceae bacterium]
MVASTVQFNALDPNALGDLKRLARGDQNSPEALRAAAKQFEALFLQMVLKSMRDAMPSNGLMDSDQTRLFQSLQDQQLTMNMAQGKGVGLAEVLFRQLGGVDDPASSPAAIDSLPDGERAPGFAVPARAASFAVSAERAEKLAAGLAELAASVRSARVRPPEREDGTGEAVGPRGFVDRVWQHAVEASRSTGIPPHFMVAQAALETGWGKAELQRADGGPSYNLFNIKAGANWTGPVVERSVTEYANGQAYTEQARFRAYGSYAEAFRDYAALLRNSPRYAQVLGQQDAAGFARSLQGAGYATDPMYADKLTRIIGGSTLREALSG